MTAVLRTIAFAAVIAAMTATSAHGKPLSTADAQQAVVKRINDVRAKHGLQRLKPAPRLMRSARGWAGHMARTKSFGHGSSYARAGFRRSGEIIAMTRGRKLRAKSPLRMWMASSGHRALILDRSFRYVGAGPARAGSAAFWVVHFGAH